MSIRCVPHVIPSEARNLPLRRLPPPPFKGEIKRGALGDALPTQTTNTQSFQILQILVQNQRTPSQPIIPIIDITVQNEA